jgi:hypothetical protein
VVGECGWTFASNGWDSGAEKVINMSKTEEMYVMGKTKRKRKTYYIITESEI